jgi:hypothetical protein
MARKRKWIAITTKRAKREAIYCYYCFREIVQIKAQFRPKNAKTIDHFIPLDKGGTNFQYNIVICCYQCNSIKANMLPGEFNSYISLLWQRNDFFKYTKKELRTIINQIKSIRAAYNENMQINKPYYLTELPYKKGILQQLREKFKAHEIPSCNNKYAEAAEC